jgi:hypothetical protein
VLVQSSTGAIVGFELCVFAAYPVPTVPSRHNHSISAIGTADVDLPVGSGRPGSVDVPPANDTSTYADDPLGRVARTRGHTGLPAGLPLLGPWCVLAPSTDFFAGVSQPTFHGSGLHIDRASISPSSVTPTSRQSPQLRQSPCSHRAPVRSSGATDSESVRSQMAHRMPLDCRRVASVTVADGSTECSTGGSSTDQPPQ